MTIGDIGRENTWIRENHQSLREEHRAGKENLRTHVQGWQHINTLLQGLVLPNIAAPSTTAPVGAQYSAAAPE